MRNTLRELWYNIKAFKYLIGEERKYKSDVSWFKKMQLLFKGFSSEKYKLYDLAHNNINDYLSDFQRRKTQKINDNYALLIDDKKIFEMLLESKNIVPATYGKILNNEIILQNNKVDIDRFISFLQEKKILIIKKQRGGGGKGIYRIEYKNDHIIIDNEVIHKDKLSIFIEELEESLITQHLQQAGYSNEIYPGTINTIRMLVMKDPRTKESFIATAVHKFGSKKTEPVDNVWAGGMTSLVNLESGILERSALHNQNNKEIEWIDVHPDTKKEIKATQIPHWNKVKEEILSLTNQLENIQYVGWDIVITDNGFKIIEGNNYSDVNILQIHQPLLKNKKIQSFYKYHKIL